MRNVAVLWLALFSALIGCSGSTVGQDKSRTDVKLIAIAEFKDSQPTGVAVSAKGRVFVCFPRWAETHDLSVVEVLKDGQAKPYPDKTWNEWSDQDKPGARDHFVCAQSVWVDPEDNLWILDPANPQMKGVVEGGPKLIKVELRSNEITQTIHFDAKAAPAKSYLNDVRVDLAASTAYITDSGIGAIVVVDLKTGTARRVLENHPSTQAEPDARIVIDGKEIRDLGGKPPMVNADGIAFYPPTGKLYYHALTGKTLYELDSKLLRDPKATPEQLDKAVKAVDKSAICDGMLCDAKGNVYMTDLAKNGIVCRNGAGKLVNVIQDKELLWPDSLTIGPDQQLYVTASQIHLMGKYNSGQDMFKRPFKLFRVEGWNAASFFKTAQPKVEPPAPIGGG